MRAGEELKNPFPPLDTARRERGTTVFANFCQCCHGPLGLGNGPVALGGFPPPASLQAERAVQMKDGQMFHVLTYGQGNMPSVAAQLSDDDRWSVILYVRMTLQAPSTPAPAATRMQAVAQLFNETCAGCHGQDGAGNPAMKKALPLIPNFTSLAWQMSQTEVAIVNQINYGTAPMMPAFRYKLKPEEVVGLAVYVRSFAAHQPGAAPAAPPPSQLTAESIYGTSCFACHDLNGKGNPAFKQNPAAGDLPDFTDPFWQRGRTDDQLAKSILEGMGPGKLMVSRKDELGPVDVKDMVALVRRFKDGKYVATLTPPKLGGPVLPPPPTAASLDPLTRDAVAVGGLLASPSGAGPLLAYSEAAAARSPPGLEPTPPPVTGLSDEEAARVRVGQTIFSQYCMVCHGHDGTGSSMRQALPQIPDFTSPKFPKDWPDDFRLRSIVLTGNNQMPANVGRVTADQARDLVDFIRTFRPEGERPSARAVPTRSSRRRSAI